MVGTAQAPYHQGIQDPQDRQQAGDVYQGAPPIHRLQISEI
jgi:hypothetical protein